MTAGNVHKTRDEVDGLPPMLDVVQRIDWSHCTILPTDAVPAATELRGDLVLPLENFLNGINADQAWPLYVADTGGVILFVNTPYRQLAAHCDSVTASLPGAAQNRAAPPLMSVVQDVLALRQGITLQEKVRIDGRQRHFRSRHFPLLDNMSRVMAVAGIYLDCTKEMEGLEAARTAQARFQDFARASSDWFWETDRDGKLTLLSDRFTALSGTAAAAYLGQRLEDMGVLQPVHTGVPSLREQMASGRAFRDYCLEVTGRDGEIFTFQLSGVPVFDSDSGEFMGFRGAGMDITSRIRAERQALEMRQSLENTLEELTNKNIQLDMASSETNRALKVKSDFLAAMSHELRTPLNAIIGFAEAMKMEVFGSLNPLYKNYSGDIMNAGRHLLDLINDVLDVAVIESKKVKLDIETVPLADIIDAALSLVVIRAQQKALDITAVRVPQHWSVEVDVRRATQVIVNLLSNAVKFTPDRGKVGIEVAPLDDRLLAVTVWDTGIGIPVDKHEMLFEKFQQVNDSVYSRKQEGTGLGLHISRELARLMGGDISMTSVPGEGSRFTVTFRRAE